MGAAKYRWKPAPSGNPKDDSQVLEDIRDLLYVIAQATEVKPPLAHRDFGLASFARRRREVVPGDGH